MTIPFSDLFRKVAARFSASASQQAPSAPTPAKPARVKKTGHESLSKTVLPNRTRSFSAPDPLRAAASLSSTPGAASLQLGSGKVVAGARASSRSRELPRALALALEPKFERAISLKIADFIEQVPAGFIKPVEILDTTACVSLKASEIEKGMPEGKPSISLPSLYQQVPEIFLRSVPLDDETRVPLPYANVLEQFSNARVRTDQELDQDVPQVDTPILQATIEDTKRFGTKMEPLQASALPPVPVSPATARTLAHAEPEPVALETRRSSTPAATSHPVVSLHSPELTPKSEWATPPPATVPLKSAQPLIESEPSLPQPKTSFQFPPNGTGGPDSERVPASSRPPVPIDLSSSPTPLHLRLTSKTVDPVVATPPKEPVEPAVDVEEKTTLVEPKQAARPIKLEPEIVTPVESTPAEIAASKSEPVVETAPKIAAPAGDVITLALKSLLQNLPPFQLTGEIAVVADDAQVEFPISLIAPQLATGRVTVSSEVFQAAIPEKYRELFHIDEANTPVSLPLQEVLKHLPPDALKRRVDQEKAETGKDFETPFLIKAKEDAERLHGASKRSAEPVAKPQPAPATEKKIDNQPGEKIEAKEVMAQAGALPDVKACAITFADGLNLAGMLPPEMRADGLCAMAPSVLQKIARHMGETKLGELKAMTLHSDDAAISFFARGNVCLAALHADGSLTAETQTQLADLTEKLSRTYAQPEISHVHH